MKISVSQSFLRWLFVIHSYFFFVHANVYVRTPDNNTKSYLSQEADFGPTFPLEGLQGYLYLSKPLNGCSPIPPVKPSGFGNNSIYNQFLLVQRGDCYFDVKVKNAQNAGYNAVIVYNVDSNTLHEMSSSGVPGIQIPSTFVGAFTGQHLKNNLAPTRSLVLITAQSIPPLKFYLVPFLIIVAVCFLTMLIFVTGKYLRERRKQQHNRLPRRAFKKLPIKKYKKGDPYDVCAICLDDYEVGHKLRILPCKHAFHSKCIDPWLTENRRTCPLCKRRINRDGTEEQLPATSQPNEETDDETSPLLSPWNSAENEQINGDQQVPFELSTSTVSSDSDGESSSESDTTTSQSHRVRVTTGRGYSSLPI